MTTSTPTPTPPRPAPPRFDDEEAHITELRELIKANWAPAPRTAAALKAAITSDPHWHADDVTEVTTSTGTNQEIFDALTEMRQDRMLSAILDAGWEWHGDPLRDFRV